MTTGYITPDHNVVQLPNMADPAPLTLDDLKAVAQAFGLHSVRDLLPGPVDRTAR
ncbi:MAG: hypothetical protein JWN03_4329 [Nocardia sp.]|nr:hypothetical protein [Nocardia sp.]